MQWPPGAHPQEERRRPIRGVLEILQDRAAPYLERYGDNQIPGAGALYNSIFRSGTEMVPGVGDLVGVEDLQAAAEDNDWAGMGVGLLAAVPGIPAIGGGSRAARRARGLLDDAADAASAPGGGLTEAEAALARYRAVNPDDTGARVLNPGDEGYPTNAQWDEASQAYVAPAYPTAPRSEWYGEANYEAAGGRMVDMSPQEYLASVRPLEIDDVSRENIDDLKRHIESGRTLDPLKIFQGGREDGRHRAVAALEMGIPTVPVVRFDDLPPVEPDYPIRAYHGSPHSFDRFSLDKIGTGEGAQAYGHGLYFAESEDVARAYRNNLAGFGVDDAPIDGSLGDYADPGARVAMKLAQYQARGGDKFSLGQALVAERRAFEANGSEFAGRKAQALQDEINALFSDAPLPAVTPQGSMYEVGINAHPDTFLDWDRPLSEQPESVRTAVDDILANVPGVRDNLQPVEANRDGRSLLGAFSEALPYGENYSAALTNELQQRGVPGIRYLDGNSRGAADVNDLRGTRSMWETALRKSPDDAYARSMFEEADAALRQAEAGLSSNYVVFNDELVKILRKYGISGLGLGLGLNAFGGDQSEVGPNALSGPETEYQGTALNPL